MRHLFGTLVLLAALCASPSSAAITATGDVDPANPATWTANTTAYIGDSADGALTVNGGSTITSNIGYLGVTTGAAGTVTIDGAGSTWTDTHVDNLWDGSLGVGDMGNGTLRITNGGSFTSPGSGYIGYGSGGSGTLIVDGAGSTWSGLSELNVGGSGTATLRITNGGTVASSSGYIGSSNNATATVIVDGTGSTWSDAGDFDVGNSGKGTLTVTNGGTVTDNYGTIGNALSGPGTVAIDGAGSTWSNNGYLFVGYAGAGTLKTTNGSMVTSHYGFIGFGGSSGTVSIDGAGSKWVDLFDLYVGDAGKGTLEITNGATATSSRSSYIGYNSTASSAVLIDGAGSTWTNSGGLYVGYSGNGTLSITNGGAVSAAGDTLLACVAASTGTLNFGAHGGTLATESLGASPTQVTGSGTINASGLVSDVGLVFNSARSLVQTISWNGLPGQNIVINLNMSAPANNGMLGAGWTGVGSLTIQNGISVASNGGFLGYNSGSTGTATVDGAGSTWTDSGGLYVGYSGTGTLNIIGGGAVGATGVSVNSSSLLAIDVGRGSSLTVAGGSGTITNSGTVRLLAGAGVPAGNTYSPISAGTWSGYGLYQALGGTWNATSHQFTVSATQAGAAGTPIAIVLGQQQRVLVTDAATGAALGASFLAAAGRTPITFTGSLLGGSTLASLTGLLPPGDSVMSGWTCSTTGYAAGSPAYLSLAGSGNGGGFYAGSLEVWDYNGSTWSLFSADDLTYDGTFASFTVTSFGSFAVTGVAVMPGDANRDGSVDINDLTIVLTNFGQTGCVWPQGCMDGDPTGTVDVNDLTIVLANFGQTAGSSAAGPAAVPEPSAILLLAAGVVSLLACACRRRR